MFRSALFRAFVLLSVAGCGRSTEPVGAPPTCLSPASASTEHPLGETLQAALDDAVADGLPGVGLAIRDGDGSWEGGAGLADLGRSTPVETCHRTRIASVTKTFVAVTVLQLAEEGRLDLDASLASYLPDVGRELPHANQITVRQLLDHTSGVRNFLDVNMVVALVNDPSRTWTVQQCFEHAKGKTEAFLPGEEWGYSNTNYVLLGWIIEAVAGAPHEAVMAERLFEPLGLSDTSYVPDAFDFDGVVHGYFDLMGDGVLLDSTHDYANLCVGPDGGIVSSARDVRTFYEHLFSARDLLQPDTLAQMTPRVATGYDDFPRYGLGVESWVSEAGGAEAIGHGGHEFGYRTFAYHFPTDDVTFVLWVNASSLQPTDSNIAAAIEKHRDRLRDIVLGLE